jgi:hypothetical protein
MVFTDFLGVTTFVRFVVVDFNADFLAVIGVVLTAAVAATGRFFVAKASYDFRGNMAVDVDKLRSFNIH